MMITIINGNQDPQNKDFDNYINELAHLLNKTHHVHHIYLQSMNIKHCLGCYGCWQKTPGKCVLQDDMEEIYSKYMLSDVVLFASPIDIGFTTSLLKTCHDRSIPLIHPYAEIVDGELHHLSRYKTYPKLGLLLQKEEDTDDEDIRIITDIYARIAINFKSRFVYSTVINTNSLEDVVHEISHL